MQSAGPAHDSFFGGFKGRKVKGAAVGSQKRLVKKCVVFQLSQKAGKGTAPAVKKFGFGRLPQDEAAEYEAQGARYYRMKLYEKAVEAYQKAYEIGGSGRAVSGPSLARTLEMLGRFDGAIDASSRMIQNQAVNEFGIIMAQVHIARLTAIKEGRPVPSYADPANPIPPHDIAAYIFPEDPVYAEAEAKLKKYNDEVRAMTAKIFKL